MGERKPCKECPWITNYKHSESWKGYVEKMTKGGQIKNGIHKCHMITSDAWGLHSPVDESNMCIGSQEERTKIENNGTFRSEKDSGRGQETGI